MFFAEANAPRPSARMRTERVLSFMVKRKVAVKVGSERELKTGDKRLLVSLKDGGGGERGSKRIEAEVRAIGVDLQHRGLAQIPVEPDAVGSGFVRTGGRGGEGGERLVVHLQI